MRERRSMAVELNLEHVGSVGRERVLHVADDDVPAGVRIVHAIRSDLHKHHECNLCSSW